jgi:hypothetical protein
MNTTTEIIIGVIVLVVIVAALVLVSRQMAARRQARTAALRSRFGPEYGRAVEDTGAQKKAEAQLAQREKRVEGFTIVPLTQTLRDRYVRDWAAIQAQFVDEPKSAVTNADDLLGQVMSSRGYPVGDFEQRAADLSVDHPVVVQNYRAAHEIAVRHAQGNASTEDLRQAMLSYRRLFDELAEAAPAPSPTPAPAAVSA